MIKISDLKFEYPRSNFSLAIPQMTIARGEKIAFVGPSGSGKTTLLNLMAGILAADSGQVQIGDFNMSAARETARRNYRIANIGMVFQRFELIEYLTVRENIFLPYLINSSLEKSGNVNQTIDRIADRMQLADKLGRRPERLSQGEQQRVAIGRAILSNPSLVLADEPTGSLDPENKQRIIDLLFEQCSENESTLVVVTHDTGILNGFDQVIDFADYRHAKSTTSAGVAE